MLIDDRHQAIIWTNAGILSIGPLKTHFGEALNQNVAVFIDEKAFGHFVSVSMYSPSKSSKFEPTLDTC